MAKIKLSGYAPEIWQYLISVGCTEAGAAGLMGNLYSESHLNPSAVEETLLARYRDEGFLSWSAEPYSQANYDRYLAYFASGKISEAEFIHPRQYTGTSHQYGYGLAQWTSEGRKKGLLALCRANGTEIDDLGAQLDWLYYEMTHSYTGVWEVLTSTDSVRDASDAVLSRFEQPASWRSQSATRADYGRQIFDVYGGINMSIVFGSARINEIGRASGGRAGDQTGSEVSTQPYYKHAGGGWYVLRPKSAAAAAKIAADTLAACKNSRIGYGQADRDAGVAAAKAVGWDCSRIARAVNLDCSALMRVAIAYATGRDLGDFYTGNQRQVMLASGLFDDVTSRVNQDTGAGLCNGDILVTRQKGHTGAIVSGAGVRAANTSESTGAATTAQKGAYMFTTQQIYEGCPASNSVYLAQEILKARGIYKGALDKQFGPQMAAAVRAYQQARHLEVDAIIGPATWRDMIAL